MIKGFMKKVDYKIIQKTKLEFQKLLNQWKHLFELEIIWITNTWIYPKGYEITALIKRTEREL